MAKVTVSHETSVNCVTLPSFDSPISNFYRGRSIFITGVSGFIGKVLLEKILRSLPEIGTIYVLLRPKKGVTSPNDRLKELFSSRVFSFHPYSQEQLSKVIPLAGDVSLPFFGLSNGDLEKIANEVTVIFHVAASIRFDSLLAEHVKTNVLGSIHLTEVCTKVNHLDCLVFVSTAFSNCHLDEIDELIYPLDTKPEQLVKLYESLDPQQLESYVPQLIGNRPNTYVYTKAVAEHVVASKIGDTTLVLARPAIVGPAVSEPIAGWTDSLHGPAGLSILAGLGIIQTVDWDYHVKPDAIPVDFLSNALISAAWHSFTTRNRKQTIYNMTSSNLRPMSAGDFMTYARKASLEKPSIYAIRPLMEPPRKRQSRLVFKIRAFFYHILFAYLIDTILTLIGRKRIMVRIVNKMHHAIDLMQYFALRDWKFKSNNYIKMMADLSESDGKTFNCDIRSVEDEEAAIANVWLGCRRYILKEPDDNVTLARKKYTAICFFYSIYQIMLAYFVLKFILTWTPIVYLICLLVTYIGNCIDFVTGTKLFHEHIGDIIDILG